MREDGVCLFNETCTVTNAWTAWCTPTIEHNRLHSIKATVNSISSVTPVQ